MSKEILLTNKQTYKYLKIIYYIFMVLMLLFTQTILASDYEDGYVTPRENIISQRCLISRECTLLKTFNKGDLLYGLNHEARKRYTNELDMKLGIGALFTADRYNNLFLVRLENKSQEEIYKEIKSEKNNEKDQNKFLENTEKMNEIISYRNYIISNIKNDFFKEGKSEHRLLKRFCKDAIRYKIKNGYKIHFLLDSLNVLSALNKVKPYAESYTSSELRFIKRNWEEFKCHVFFYKNGEVTQAPWEKQTVLNLQLLISYKTDLGGFIREEGVQDKCWLEDCGASSSY